MADKPTIVDEINEISDVPEKSLGYLRLLVSYQLDLPNLTLDAQARLVTSRMVHDIFWDNPDSFATMASWVF